VSHTHLTLRQAEYDLGTVPDGIVVQDIVLGADVQQAFVNYVVRAFCENGNSFLLSYGRVSGVDDLVEIGCTSSYRIGGADRKIDIGLVDSGYLPEHVYRACLAAMRRGFRLVPSKGSGEKFLTRPVRSTDIHIGKTTYHDSLIIYSDNDFKRLLYIESIKNQNSKWWIPRTVGSDYTEEMLREHLVTDKLDRVVWKRFGANHYADAEKLCLVVRYQSRGG